MAKWGELTRATIHQIAWEVREGEADLEDARHLLELFCETRAENIPPELITHLQSAFSNYLTGNKKNLEAALGLKRRQGRPTADPDMRLRLAVELLQCRLDGKTHEECLDIVCSRFGWGPTIVGEAWKDHKCEAVLVLRLDRAANEFPWTVAEVRRLGEIFSIDADFLPSEKSENKPA